jgi:DNA-binding protein H-NS
MSVTGIDSDELKAAEAALKAAQTAVLEIKSRSLNNAIAQARALIKEHGLTAQQLGLGGGKVAGSAGAGKRGRPVGSKNSGAGRKQYAKMPPKFKNPAGDQTWSGHGAVPGWMRALEAAGRKRTEFAI